MTGEQFAGILETRLAFQERDAQIAKHTQAADQKPCQCRKSNGQVQVVCDGNRYDRAAYDTCDVAFNRLSGA